MEALENTLALGIDGFAVCIALGARPLSWRERCWTSAAFGLCDAAATLLAPVIGLGALQMPNLPIYLVFIVLVGRAVRFNRLSLCVLPLVSSIDNLVAPATANSLVCGAGSAALALIGLQIGAAARFMISRTWALRMSVRTSV
jgi:putative Mn2+ efflux pump MntP